MSNRDETDSEVQVAAVVLSQQFGMRSQAKIATELQKRYRDRGAFDNARVSRLCKYAVNNKLAIAPSTVRLVAGPNTARWRKMFDDTEQAFLRLAEIQSEVDNFCHVHAVPVTPAVVVVPGDVTKPSNAATSQFAENAANIALKYLKDWSSVNSGRRLRLGVTWGTQLHYAAIAATNALRGGYLSNVALSVMPLVGLPIGGHRSDIMSSSEIARALSRRPRTAEINDAGEEYDLQLVPAYLPEKEFTEAHLEGLYRLLNLTQGWTRIFGPKHMTQQSHERPTVNAPEVFDCNFIWSSVSNLHEPFGFTMSKQRSLFPFADNRTRNPAQATRPVADCGGIPLWDRSEPAYRSNLERSFNRRWTGIKREQWQDCVKNGAQTLNKDNVVSGAVLFAPTAEKALPVLHAIRDRLANVVMLGRPCTDKLLEILVQLRASGSRRQEEQKKRNGI